MNKYATVGCLILGFAASQVHAKPTSHLFAGEFRLGVVDMETVVAKSPAGIRAIAAIEASRKAKQDALDKQRNDLLRISDELKKQQPVLAPQEYALRLDEVTKKLVDLDQTCAKLERVLEQDRQAHLATVLKQAEPELLKVARAEGLSVILEKNSTLWVDVALDLTERIRTELK